MASATRTLSFILQVFEGVMKDASLAFPAYAEEFEKDFSRLRRVAQDRGLYTVMVDLPALAKHFDRCLAEGHYTVVDLPLGRAVSKTVRVPRMFRALYLMIFESSGRLKEDYNVEAIRFLRQVLYLAKKFDWPCSQEDICAEVRTFLDVEDSLPTPHRVWLEVDNPTDQELAELGEGGFTAGCPLNLGAPDYGLTDEESFRFLEVLDYVCGTLASLLGHYDPTEWEHRHGPGAVSERLGTFNKYLFHNWNARLDSAFPFSECGVHDYHAWAEEITRRELSSHELPSRMIAVPKTLLKPRLIAAEPTELVWCQQNVRHFMTSRFESTWIRKFVRLADQTFNQALARSGSRDGQLATVDLSAASDRVTCDVVGCMLRGNLGLLRALHACRTRSMTISDRLAGNEDGMTIRLKKFSTMGSAVTFPVETMWFLCVALAATLASRGKSASMLRTRDITGLEGKVAVYGDDIIVPTDAVRFLLRGLELTYSKPNADKTFWTGMFRESCGSDCIGGVDVSPTYLHKVPEKNRPESLIACVDTSNNFYKKWFLNVVAALDQHLEDFGIPVPLRIVDSGSFGRASFVIPFSVENPPKGARWNRNLQRFEVPTTNFRVVKGEHFSIDDNSALLQFFTEAPDPWLKWEAGWCERPMLKYRHGWATLSDLIS